MDIEVLLVDYIGRLLVQAKKNQPEWLRDLSVDGDGDSAEIIFDVTEDGEERSIVLSSTSFHDLDD